MVGHWLSVLLYTYLQDVAGEPLFKLFYAVKQQIERHEEIVASGMRTARAIEKCAEADTVPKFEEFVRTTLRGGKLADRYAAIVAEDEAKAWK